MKKNYYNAILIAFIGGFFGLQEFYVGNIVRGIFAIIFCWTGIPTLIAFVQSLKWLFKGEEYFNNKYNKTF